MEVYEMRDAIKNSSKYCNSKVWKNRVDNMADNQVMAIYYRMLRDGDLVKPGTILIRFKSNPSNKPK